MQRKSPSPRGWELVLAAGLLVSSACARNKQAPAEVLEPQVYSSQQFDPETPEGPTLEACAELDQSTCIPGAQPVCGESRTQERTDYDDPCVACKDPEIVAWWPESCDGLAKRSEEP